VIEQLALPVCQVSVAPLGSGSLIATLFAVPGPLLVTTMVKVAVSPAVIARTWGRKLICR